MNTLIAGLDTEGEVHDVCIVLLHVVDDDFTIIHDLNKAPISCNPTKDTEHFLRSLSYYMDKYQCSKITLMAWNANHDARMLKNFMHDLFPIPCSFVDLAKVYVTNRKSTFNTDGKIPYSIQSIGRMYIDNDYKQLHDAMNDTLDMITIMENQMAHISMKNPDFDITKRQLSSLRDQHTSLELWNKIYTSGSFHTAIGATVNGTHDIIKHKDKTYAIRKGWAKDAHYGYALVLLDDQWKPIRRISDKTHILTDGLIHTEAIQSEDKQFLDIALEELFDRLRL